MAHHTHQGKLLSLAKEDDIYEQGMSASGMRVSASVGRLGKSRQRERNEKKVRTVVYAVQV